MRILLIYPPNNPCVLAPSNFEPLALEVLSALVPEHDVRIFDMRYETYLSLNRMLHSFQPHITGLTCNNTLHVNRSIEVLDFVRTLFPSSVTVVGGHHPSIFPQDFYLPTVDYIFIGWADKSFPQFIHAILNQELTHTIPGIITLSSGQVVNRTENPYDLTTEEIPFPDRDATRHYWPYYKNEIGYRTALVNTARGCPFRCSFCSVWKASQGHFLIRPAADVFSELQALPGNIRRVFFADDNTFIDTENAEELADMIRGSGIRRKYSGYCRSDTIVKNPVMMRKWKAIGLDNLCVGFEGISDEALRKVNKANKAEKNLESVRILHEIGIPFRSYLLIDPEYEPEDFRRTLKYVNDHYLVNPIFTVKTPLPGTDYYEEVKSAINQSYDYFDFMHSVIPTRMETKGFYLEIISLFMKAYSFRRHLGIRFLMMKNRMMGKGDTNRYLQAMPLPRLLLLKILAIFMKRKLYRFIREAA